MTKDRARKLDARALAADTGVRYPAALAAVTPTLPRRKLPDPEPQSGAATACCPTCRGRKITGDQYELTGDTAIIVVDVLCPTCLGCGRAEHRDCRPGEHADPESLGLDPYDDEEFDEDHEDDGSGYCYSCHDRRWYPTQALTDTQVVYLRTPCGCTTDMLVAA